MKRLSAFIAMLCLLYPNVHNAFAHSGGTDRYGCHVRTSTGTRHCHTPKNNAYDGTSGIARPLKNNGHDDMGAALGIVVGVAIVVASVHFFLHDKDDDQKFSLAPDSNRGFKGVRLAVESHDNRVIGLSVLYDLEPRSQLGLRVMQTTDNHESLDSPRSPGTAMPGCSGRLCRVSEIGGDLRGCQARRPGDFTTFGLRSPSHVVMSGERLPLISKPPGRRQHGIATGYVRLAEAMKKVGNIVETPMTGAVGGKLLTRDKPLPLRESAQPASNQKQPSVSLTPWPPQCTGWVSSFTPLRRGWPWLPCAP